MRGGAKLRAVPALCLVLCAAVLVALIVQRQWMLFAIVVVGSAISAYVTRHDARWFRQ